MSITINTCALLIATLVILTGCAEPSPPYAVVLEQGMTQYQIETVYVASESWNEALERRVFTFADSYDRDGCDQIRVVVRENIEVNDAHGFVGAAGKDGCNYVVELTVGSLQDVTTVQHELGHTLGLDDSHEEDRESVMYHATTRWKTFITEKNVADVNAIWGW